MSDVTKVSESKPKIDSGKLFTAMEKAYNLADSFVAANEIHSGRTRVSYQVRYMPCDKPFILVHVCYAHSNGIGSLYQLHTKVEV